jgi:hypothetical protein
MIKSQKHYLNPLLGFSLSASLRGVIPYLYSFRDSATQTVPVGVFFILNRDSQKGDCNETREGRQLSNQL